MKNLLVVFVSCLVVVAMHSLAQASGYGIFTQGARALGRANASIAKLDSPSVVFFNPALLSELDGTQIEGGTTLIFPQRSFSGATTAETEDTVYFPATLYLSHELNDNFTLGFGVFNPFGLGTDWPDDWEGRYLATRSEIVTYDIRPVIAWQATPTISVAAGIDYVYLDAELERKMDLSGLGLGDGNLMFSGDGDGFGFNLGLAWKIIEQVTLGVSYRSEVDIDIDAKMEFQLPPPAFIPTTGASTSMTLPQQFSAGIAYDVTNTLLLEFSVRWEDWTAFDQLHIIFDQPVNGQPEEIQQRDWHDTWAYSLGGEYLLGSGTRLLFGYLYGEDPIPDATFEPAIPDSPSHLFTLGVSYPFGSYTLDASYGYQYLEARIKNNSIAPPPSPLASAANGKYESDIHLVGLSLGYKF